ncbi:hypothetical protein [Mycobacterium intracellulare]|uniref:hypothetical protein n=1 Tax=Mycobacterium intracellulare TaxID=1767 RepID=UPI00109ED250|nr:hypothetical protein [Mycobacterium intracellulare]
MKTRSTAEEHRWVGGKVNAIHHELQGLLVFLDSKYPHSDRYVRLVHKALRAVDELRCEGDNAACRDEPEQFDTCWYYGPSRYALQPITPI